MSAEVPARANVLRQFMRFFVVGIVGFVANAAIVELLAREGRPLVAQLIAFPIAATVTWWLNRQYTFGASQHRVHHEWLRYILGNFLGWAANNGVYVWLVLHFPLAYQHPSIAVAAGSVSGMFFNFAVLRWVVFGRR